MKEFKINEFILTENAEIKPLLFSYPLKIGVYSLNI